MAGNDVDREYEQLRRLAVGDARRAREELSRLIAQQPAVLPTLMERASRAGEGRVRQVVATAVRLNPVARQVLLSWVEGWMPVEADEFALRAIKDALAAVELPPAPTPARAELPRDFAATYRYVAERLCHQVRNSLARPDTELLRLRAFVGRLQGADRDVLTEILAGLQTGFERVAKAVEYDLGDSYHAWASIHLGEWLRREAGGLGQRFGAAKLTVATRLPHDPRVWAAPFLLHTIFANLWSNAVQAVGVGCELAVTFSTTGKNLEVLVADNGPGFDDTAAASIFQTQYSSKGGRGGRGLLEIAEAVGRLQGRVSLAMVDSARRVQILLPLESA